MGALIILHGLFLLHCNTRPTPVGSLVPQTCEVLAIQDSIHSYQALGDGDPLPQSFPDVNYLNAWPMVSGVSGMRNPDQNGLAQRVLVLTQGLANVVPNVATTRIVVPMPDDILGANIVWLNRADLLQRTPPNVVRTKTPFTDGSIRVAQTIILRYRNAGPFTLADGANFTVFSKLIGSYNVLALFAWPARTTTDCSVVLPHQPMNPLIDIGNGANPAIKMMGVQVVIGHPLDDDSEMASFNLPPGFLKPPCIKEPGRTGSQTGCAPEVIVE
jgi:hypothetical protein